MLLVESRDRFEASLWQAVWIRESMDLESERIDHSLFSSRGQADFLLQMFSNGFKSIRNLKFLQKYNLINYILLQMHCGILLSIKTLPVNTPFHILYNPMPKYQIYHRMFFLRTSPDWYSREFLQWIIGEAIRFDSERFFPGAFWVISQFQY